MFCWSCNFKETNQFKTFLNYECPFSQNKEMPTCEKEVPISLDLFDRLAKYLEIIFFS